MDVVQIGIRHLDEKILCLEVGVMDFSFIGGTMGSGVGEKITRLIEYATCKSLPLIIVCAFGSAHMQEGILRLMQMAKIPFALQKYQVLNKLPYIEINMV